TADVAPNATAAKAVASARADWRARVRPMLLALIFPALVLVAWEFVTTTGRIKIVPPPYEVAVMMWDFAFGGIYDDAFSATLHIHMLESMRRVYGGFALAALVAIPLGLLIGRIKLIRQMLDPTFQILRPI